MKLTSEIETEGLRAYEQARAFERLQTWRLPLGYGIFVAIPVLCGTVLVRVGHTQMAKLHFGVAVFFAIAAWFQWQHLKRKYAKNFALVAELEKTYGDQLPWVQVNNHFAALEKLQQDLAAENREQPPL